MEETLDFKNLKTQNSKFEESMEVLPETKEREQRNTNVMLIKCPESNKKDPIEDAQEDLTLVLKTFDTMGVPNVEVQRTIRLGLKEDGKIRPLKVILCDRKPQRNMIYYKKQKSC